MIITQLLANSKSPVDAGVPYFHNGQEMNPEYVETMFGPQDIYVPDVDPPVFKLASMTRCAEPARVLAVSVVDEDGGPVQDAVVGLAPLGHDAPTRKAPTGPGGVVLFSMDDTFFYSVPMESPRYVVGIDSGHSWIVPVGVVRGRDRKDWLNPTFQLIGPRPVPRVDNWAILFCYLETITDQLAGIIRLLPG